MQQHCQRLLPLVSANAEQSQSARVGEMGSHSMGDMGHEEQILFPTLPTHPKVIADMACGMLEEYQRFMDT